MHRLARQAWGGGALLSLVLGMAVWWQPLFLGHLLERPDTLTHLRWSYEFFAALQEGVWHPRWAYASHGGLGDPTFVYYQPLLYYVTALVSSIGVLPARSLMIATSLPYMLMAWIGYAHIVRDGSVRRAVFGAALLATCPAVFFLAMEGGALPWAMAIPLCVLFVLESIKDQPRVAKTAILLSLVCLTHLLSGLIVLLCVGGARLIFAFPGRGSWASNLRWAGAVVLGIALAGFFVYPAVTQQGLINPGAWTADLSLNWNRSFAFPVVTWWRYGLQWFTFQWALPVLALAFSLVVIALLRRWSAQYRADAVHERAWRLVLVALSALVLSSELSYPLFALVAPLQKLQWPYRFIPLALALSSLAFCSVAFRSSLARKLAWPQVACISLVAAHFLLAGAMQYKAHVGGASLRPLSAAMTGDFGQPEYLIARLGPDWKRYNADGQLTGECEKRGVQCTSVVKRTHGMSLVVTASAPTRITLPLFAFPAWEMRIAGQVKQLEFSKESGLISVPVNAGVQPVEVRWVGIPAELVGNVLSCVALLLLALVLILEKRESQGAPDSNAYSTASARMHLAAKKNMQFLLFAGVGAAGTIFHYLILICLVTFAHSSPGSASFAGAVGGACVNYFLNRQFTFQSTRDHRETIPRFVALAAFGAILNGLIVGKLSSMGANFIIAQVFTTVLVLTFNFLMSRKWIFNQTK